MPRLTVVLPFLRVWFTLGAGPNPRVWFTLGAGPSRFCKVATYPTPVSPHINTHGWAPH